LRPYIKLILKNDLLLKWYFSINSISKNLFIEYLTCNTELDENLLYRLNKKA